MTRTVQCAVGVFALTVGGLFGGMVAAPWLHGQNGPQVTAVPKELNSYRDIVKKVLPAVVSIENKGKPAVRGAPARRPAEGAE